MGVHDGHRDRLRQSYLEHGLMSMNDIKSSFLCNYLISFRNHVKIQLHNPIYKIIWVYHIVIYPINFYTFIIFKIWYISFFVSYYCNIMPIFY